MKDFGKLDYYWNGVEIEYGTENSCRESGCDDEGICRCGKIVDKEVRGVDISKIVEKIYNLLFENTKITKRNNKINQVLYGVTDEIDFYTIDRIIRSNKIWEDYKWDIKVSGGYYGQEIDGVFLEESVAKKIESQIYEAFSYTDIKSRVEWLLKLEYGDLLPELENKEWSVIRVQKSDIILASSGHLEKVSKKDLGYYSTKNYAGIRGVAIRKSEKFRLIDGYHRVTSADGDLLLLVCY
jgi:hypothetical protein